ncbi:MAG: hypothetical protein LBM77_09770 [Spirochaetaceae bacterium]|jgi:hypothetical protein|nr:hypothetical protein [Spirochaetaceae bacterium]
MEKKKRSKLLLIAFIVGLLYVLFFFVPLIMDRETGKSEILTTALWANIPPIISTISSFSIAGMSFLQIIRVIGVLLLSVLFIFYMAILPLCSIISTVFALIGWLNLKRKFVLVAVITYILNINPISAILCFVDYRLTKPKTQKEECHEEAN